MARHTTLDRLDKRGQRGYLFMIGDELAYPRVKAREVRRLIGDELTEDIPIEAMVAELTRSWELYFIIPAGAHYAADERLLRFWRRLLGQHVLQLDDPGAVCETIALTVGLAEDAIDLAEGLGHLREFGSDAGASVSRALARVETAAAVAVSPAPTGLGSGGRNRVTRL
jgi:hypothetical protein